MEKISSRLVAKGYKISWETEREQVISTSMHLPLNCSACVISKFQVLFRYKDKWQHFSFQKHSSQNTLTPLFLPCGKETWPTILKEHPDIILAFFFQALSSFYSTRLNKEQAEWVMGHEEREEITYNINLNNRFSDSRRTEKSTILQE